MTGMLASVNSLEETKLVLAENVDIIDLKEPALGSLGGVDIRLVKKIVAFVSGQCPTSATIGDLPMQPDLVFKAVNEMVETGVDYVKIGFFPSANQVLIIEKLAQLANHIDMIAVLFADAKPNFELIDRLNAAGFTGIMLDTLDKTRGSLTGVMAKTEIENVVKLIKSKGLICGLAGSLKLEDIPLLMPHQPDYLGFRGALCNQHLRVGRINARFVQNIKQTMADFSC
jgi:(5-formylfuran-3-yl)methyl phosphate synthase